MDKIQRKALEIKKDKVISNESKVTMTTSISSGIKMQFKVLAAEMELNQNEILEYLIKNLLVECGKDV